MNRFSFLTILIFGLCACNSGGYDTVTIIKNGSEKEYLIHLKKVEDSLSQKLSDFADEFQFIPLETSEECFIDRGYTYISNKYILIQKYQHGILQFDLNGKFIRTLAKYGKGPTEFMRATIAVDEKNQILYLSDRGKLNYFLRFNLLSGTYMGELKKAFPGRVEDIYIHDDNQLVVSCSGRLGNNDNPYQIFWQDFDGEFINGITAPSDYYIRSSSLFKLPGGEYRYQVYDVDTIFSIKNGLINPYMLFDFGEKNPPSMDFVGYKRMKLYFEANSYVLFYNFYITSIEKNANGGTSTSGAIANYSLDKKLSKVYHAGDFLFQPTHHLLPSHQFQDIRIQDNGIVHFTYQALDLIEQAEKALANIEFKDPYRSQLEKLVSGLDVNDNPVLVIGKLLK